MTTGRPDPTIAVGRHARPAQPADRDPDVPHAPATGRAARRPPAGLWSCDSFPYVWLLTADSKATALTRLLFAMRPWYESRPPQLGGLRVASVIDPVAVSRAWALQLLLDAPSRRDEEPPRPPRPSPASDPGAARLLAILRRHDPLDPPEATACDRLLRARPRAIAGAVEILITQGDQS